MDWLSSIGDFFTGLLDGILNGLTNLGNKIGGFFSNLLDGIKDGLISLGNTIGGFFTDLLTGISNLLKELFVPTNNPFDEINTLLHSKFPFIESISSFFDGFSSSDSSSAPTFSITYGNYTMDIIDFSLYAPYRLFVHSIIIAFATFHFVKWLISFVPKLLSGI